MHICAFDEKSIDAIFSEISQCHLPGVAVGISVGGTPVYRKGFGLASMELPIVLGPSMRMRIFSTSKHFAAFVYMLLCEAGKAQLDDQLGKFLPELNPVTHQVTMRQLMGHTSGLRDVHGINWAFNGTGHAVTSAELLGLYRDIDDVEFPPGSNWAYNNGGYALLSAAVERIANRTLEDILQEFIFAPVGMYNTMLRRVDTDFVPNSATLHTPRHGGGFEKSYLGTATAGEGGIVSTIDDMLLWLAHMDSPEVGSAETWRRMKKPLVLSNGVSTDYGLGLFAGRYRGVETLYHDGGGMGGNSQMLKIPSAALDIAIMANRSDISSGEFANRIVDACVSGLEPPVASNEAPLPMRVFCSAVSGRVIELRTSPMDTPWIKKGVPVACIDGYDIPVEEFKHNVLRPIGVEANMKLELTLVGNPREPSSIRFYDFGNMDELERLEPADKSNASALTGCYQSVAAAAEVRILESGSGLHMHTKGRFGSQEYTLSHLGGNVWRAKHSSPFSARGGVLVFDGDNRSFRYSTTMRTRALPFRRAS